MRNFTFLKLFLGCFLVVALCLILSFIFPSPLFLLPATLVICALFALFLSKILVMPLSLITSLMQKLSYGDFSVRIFLKSKGKTGELAQSFNMMAEKMKKIFEELSHEKEKLESILSSLSEGLLLLDREGKILLSNKSMQKIVQKENLVGKFYWEVVRETSLDNLIKKAKGEGKNLSGEIPIFDRIFFCNLALLKSGKEILLVFHDITQMKNIEKIKREFIASASHELRTPLAAIKGFIETLEEELNGKNRTYTNIIKRHTDRLINIVEDLLILSEIEEKQHRLKKEKVNVVKIIKDVLYVFQTKIRKKNLFLKFEVEENLPPVNADPAALEQMFINLIDNAIKYTDKGGIFIFIGKKENLLRVEVEDTGIGIAKEHLPRIFERFYVVDKSRSRRMGGTGLGLSIVKHIVLLHGGDINVESTPGVGTKFTINLPLD
ncbi:PAS domain-containing sensor histidine kinase [Candidatus Aerophobetes bacterium]|nr:PAS domain-containing sensor histidine kinase [Candidatus Aerophobetes bacterium]